ncbi:DUF3800 domain-containing protein [Chlorobium sp. BLA1]|uniref:DUF3800 domain-containing protein n=1 Tax=Candidatus Chlorobium masyuteum TaxID=2716876 RepID=UPI001421BF62|nr:DUF3800 domain-containing protein [Candidatus Chlorobium masyuteum]NHQ59728.1 DUF3800 domain-containing protein [Candidatus Chlorobium masyuteum]
MSRYVAYIDESGDPNFGEGASETIVVCAIVLERDRLLELSHVISEIKTSYGMEELKSKQVRSFEQRYDICRQLLASTFRILTIRVVKKSLQGDWFRYRSTFYKYIQSLLNHELFQLFGSINVTLDRYGSSDYQRSLSKYLVGRMQEELFEPELLIDSAKDNEFIQASDILAGSIRKALEDDFDKSERDQLLTLIKPSWVRRLDLPREGHYLTAIPASEMFNACMEEAKRYLECHAASSDEPKVKALEYLYYSAIDGSSEYIYTQEILEWLQTYGIILSEEQFRKDVTAALRDEGLIIVGSRKGIKIPVSSEDIRDYIKFSVNLAHPVLRRLKLALTFVSARTTLRDVDSLLSDEMRAILDEVNA